MLKKLEDSNCYIFIHDGVLGDILLCSEYQHDLMDAFFKTFQNRLYISEREKKSIVYENASLAVNKKYIENASNFYDFVTSNVNSYWSEISVSINNNHSEIDEINKYLIDEHKLVSLDSKYILWVDDVYCSRFEGRTISSDKLLYFMLKESLITLIAYEKTINELTKNNYTSLYIEKSVLKEKITNSQNNRVYPMLYAYIKKANRSLQVSKDKNHPVYYGYKYLLDTSILSIFDLHENESDKLEAIIKLWLGILNIEDLFRLISFYLLSDFGQEAEKRFININKLIEKGSDYLSPCSIYLEKSVSDVLKKFVEPLIIDKSEDEKIQVFLGIQSIMPSIISHINDDFLSLFKDVQRTTVINVKKDGHSFTITHSELKTLITETFFTNKSEKNGFIVQIEHVNNLLRKIFLCLSDGTRLIWDNNKPYYLFDPVKEAVSNDNEFFSDEVIVKEINSSKIIDKKIKSISDFTDEISSDLINFTENYHGFYKDISNENTGLFALTLLNICNHEVIYNKFKTRVINIQNDVNINKKVFTIKSIPNYFLIPNRNWSNNIDEITNILIEITTDEKKYLEIIDSLFILLKDYSFNEFVFSIVVIITLKYLFKNISYFNHISETETNTLTFYIDAILNFHLDTEKYYNETYNILLKNNPELKDCLIKFKQQSNINEFIVENLNYGNIFNDKNLDYFILSTFLSRYKGIGIAETNLFFIETNSQECFDFRVSKILPYRIKLFINCIYDININHTDFLKFLIDNFIPKDLFEMFCLTTRNFYYVYSQTDYSNILNENFSVFSGNIIEISKDFVNDYPLQSKIKKEVIAFLNTDGNKLLQVMLKKEDRMYHFYLVLISFKGLRIDVSEYLNNFYHFAENNLNLFSKEEQPGLHHLLYSFAVNNIYKKSIISFWHDVLPNCKKYIESPDKYNFKLIFYVIWFLCLLADDGIFLNEYIRDFFNNEEIPILDKKSVRDEFFNNQNLVFKHDKTSVYALMDSIIKRIENEQ